MLLEDGIIVTKEHNIYKVLYNYDDSFYFPGMLLSTDIDQVKNTNIVEVVSVNDILGDSNITGEYVEYCV